MDIDRLYRLYGPMVLRRCRRLLRDEDQALDAMQDVFAQLLLHQDHLSDRYPSSLLYRMATNLCLNRLRDGQIRLRQGQSLDDVADRIVQHIAQSEELEARSLLDLIFRRHKEGTRTIAILHFVDGMTLEETAQEVGLSVSGVRKRLDALRKTVRELRES
jgi:RNA polymerase sigma-70 factor (ECF subfamily)